MEALEFKTDCKDWVGYKPCVKQKAGLTDGCAMCPFYQPTSGNYLIMEAGGLGSILRTTVVTKEIKTRDPNAQITWATHSRGRQLLQLVPSVDKSVDVEDPATPTALAGQLFDQVINYENSPVLLSLSSILPSERHLGFVMNHLGKPSPTSGSYEFMRLQVNDPFRRRINQKSMQQILLETAGLPWKRQTYDLTTKPEDNAWAKRLLTANRIRSGSAVGLNIGSSSRHDAKRWPIENFHQVAVKMPETRFVVLAGDEEEEAYADLVQINRARPTDNLTFLGYRQSISEFVSLVNQLGVVVSSDTFGLHVGIGLGKRTISLYGPTPEQEIDTYGSGQKIKTELGCSPCFASREKDCRNILKLDCMRGINVDRVVSALGKAVIRPRLTVVS